MRTVRAHVCEAFRPRMPSSTAVRLRRARRRATDYGMRASKPHLRTYDAVFAVWTVVVVVFTAHEYLAYAADGRPGAVLHVLYWSASEWYLWALLTPAVLLAAQRFPVGRDHWLSHTLLHVALALVF